MEQEDWKKGRAFSLFLCAILSGITLVFAFSYWFSRGGKIHISMDPLYTWEILVFLAALLTMALIVVIRNNRSYVENAELQTNAGHVDPELSRTIDSIANAQHNNFPCWNRFPLRSAMYIVCCIGSIVFPIFEVYRTADNLSGLEHISSDFKTSSVLKCLRDVLCIFFCLCQLAFLLLYKNIVCKSLIIKYLVSTLVAANFTVCVNIVFSIILTARTMDIYNEAHNPNGNSSEQHTNISCGEVEAEESYLVCKTNGVEVDHVALIFHKYTYQFPIEFALLSMCFLFSLWNIFFPSRPTFVKEYRNTSWGERSLTDSGMTDGSTFGTENIESDSDMEQTPLMKQAFAGRQKRLRKSIMSTLVFMSRYAFILTFVYVVFAFSLQLYMDIRNTEAQKTDDVFIYYSANITQSEVEQWYSILQTVYTYVFCIVSFIGFMLIRKEQTVRTSFNPDYVMLLVGASGHFLLTLFETVDSVEQFMDKPDKKMVLKILFLIKSLFYYVGLYSQTMLIIKSTNLKIRRSSIENGKQLFIKGIIVFIGVCNAKSWITDSFLDPEVLTDVDGVHNQDVYGGKVWWYLAELLYPLAIVYRLFSMIICFQTCVRFKEESLNNN